MQYFGFDRPSFSLKTIGFPADAGPKLFANFTTGEYKASGVTKTFAEVFTFNRAGKAWLVKDAGLQEYAIDTPRFDNGLLIEQAATNYGVYSNLPENGNYAKRGVVFTNGIWAFNIVTAASTYLYPSPYTSVNNPLIASAVIPLNHDFPAIGFRAGDNYHVTTDTLKLLGRRIYALTTSNSGTFSGLNKIDNGKEGQYVTHYQFEGMNAQKLPTSPIVTTTTTVTRPADFLQTKISGTTLTGDWDSTLNLSISNGQMVHSGYGRIRSLEIN